MNYSIKNLKERLQTLLLIVTFFPVITEAVFKKSISDLDVSSFQLQWGMVIAFTLFLYLFFEIAGDKNINELTIRVGNFLILLNIFSYAVLLTVFAVAGESQHLDVLMWIIKISFALITFIPIIFFILVIFNLPIVVFQEIKRLNNKKAPN